VDGYDWYKRSTYGSNEIGKHAVDLGAGGCRTGESSLGNGDLLAGQEIGIKPIQRNKIDQMPKSQLVLDYSPAITKGMMKQGFVGLLICARDADNVNHRDHLRER
jgi:hypothetical protein